MCYKSWWCRSFCALLVLLLLSLQSFLGVHLSFAQQESKPHTTLSQWLDIEDEAVNDFVNDELIVELASDVLSIQSSQNQNQSSMPQLFKKFGATELIPLSQSNQRLSAMQSPQQNSGTVKVRFKGKTKKDLLITANLLENEPGIKSVSPNYFRRSSLAPSDSLFSSQWGLSQSNNIDINAPEAWDISTGDESIVVAVIDTGIHFAHPDLQGKIFENSGEIGLDAENRDKKNNGIDDDENGYIDDFHGWDATTCQTYGSSSCQQTKTPDPDPEDSAGHGTHVSGIIGAMSNNNLGVSGVTWKSKILPVQVLNSQGMGTCTDIVAGIQYAMQFADVINMSLGGQSGAPPCQTEATIIQEALGRGIVIVAAAGNQNSNSKSYPAGFSEVIAVGAIKQSGEKAPFSNYGDWIDVVAPGVEINSTIIPGLSSGCPDADGDGYAACSGTSMATPFVTGLVALIKAGNDTLTPQQITYALQNGSRDLGTAGKDIYFGYGLIDAYEILDDTNIVRPPQVSIDFPYEQMPIGNIVRIEGTAKSVNFEKYEISYSSESNPDNWRTDNLSLVSSNQPREKEYLSALSTGSLPQGKYTIKLTVYDSGQKYSQTRSVYVDKSILPDWPEDVFDTRFITVGDINNDQKQEALFQSTYSIQLINKKGNSMPGWPTYIGGNPSMRYSDLTSIGNMLDDSQHPGNEVVTGIFVNDFDVYGTAYHSDNGQVQTFNFPIYQGTSDLTNLALSDIDGDGLMDLTFHQIKDWKLYLESRNAQSQKLPGFDSLQIDPELSMGLGLDYFPVVGNIDNQKGNDVVNAVYIGPYPTGIHKVIAHNSDGGKLWEYTIVREANINTYMPYIQLVDFDGDGVMNTVFLYGKDSESSWYDNLTLVALDENGQPIEGFPVQINIQDSSATFIAADLDSDKVPELIINNGFIGQYTAINSKGQVVKGFPFNREKIKGYFTTSADLDRDGLTELTFFQADYNQPENSQYNKSLQIFTYHPDTGEMTTFQGFSKQYGYASSPYNHAITDMDRDGKAELIVLVAYPDRTLAYAYSLPDKMGKIYWPQLLHDSGHTGSYTKPASPFDITGDGKVDGQDYKSVIAKTSNTGCTLDDVSNDCKTNNLDAGFLMQFGND